MTPRRSIDEVKAGLKDGSFSIWKGPITDNTGKELLAKDVVADDKFLGGLKLLRQGRRRQGPGQLIGVLLPLPLGEGGGEGCRRLQCQCACHRTGPHPNLPPAGEGGKRCLRAAFLFREPT
jgi:hypothetical protein